MKLNLKRPIVFFDLETTGVDTAKDRIVEISMVKVMPDGEEIVKTRKINPGIHIPEEATAIHGITDEDVKECPTFAQIARSLEQFIAGCDFGGFNRTGEVGIDRILVFLVSENRQRKRSRKVARLGGVAARRHLIRLVLNAFDRNRFRYGGHRHIVA